ncbi:MAG: GNAT family N-acetyltransferase [Rhodobiaceae bacterium]|nr:GNAT family N-acetyltransferase [Rhodobiaceae bacterium]
MALTVRFADAGDTEAIAGFLAEMDRFYGAATQAPEKAQARVADWLADDAGSSRFVLAHDGDAAVGVASVAVLLPGPELSGSLFVKDLFVAEAGRSKGVGEAIMRWLADYCVARDIGRLDLTTETWNGGARRFYTRLGGALQEQKVFFRFDRDALAALAAGD